MNPPPFLQSLALVPSLGRSATVAACSFLLQATPLSAEKLPESWVNPPPDRVDRDQFEPSPLAPLVSIGEDGKLVYKPYSDRGDRLLDWSYCGYKQSSVPIPFVPVAEILEPLPGETERVGEMEYPVGPDSRKRIQEALDKVGDLEPDENGIRGAVLLRKGLYFIDDTLRIPSGVVLRGEGDGQDGTVILATDKKGGGTMIRMGSGAPISQRGGATRIEDEYVPSGSFQLTVENAGGLDAGDYVNVRKTVNDQWIEDLGMGERLRHIRGGKEGAFKRPWKASSYQFSHIRRIQSIDGRTLTLESMIPQSIAEEHGGGEVRKVTVEDLATHCGVESISLVSNYDSSESSNSKDANYGNYNNGITIGSAMDSWVRDCTVMHVSFAAVNVGDNTLQVTVRDSKSLEPVGPVRGGKRYPFNIGGGTKHLFFNCYSEDGRHDFVGGSRTMGPFAFVLCTAVRGGQSEPHHRWGTGYLYDNVITEDGSLAAINRGDSGSGHGWAASNTLFWNCGAKNIVVFDPETEGENNFAIGFTGEDDNSNPKGLHYANTRAGYWGTEREGKYYGFALMGNGHIESPEDPATPKSLFIRQLIDRIGPEQAYEVLR